ncbi:MAG: hypothetical protein KIT22_14705 [Verrucomicrobiae bacterium]|nr:hypothetical protein [Verrucomicrobiae bacterium]
MKQSAPQILDSAQMALGTTAFILLCIAGIFLLVLWMMWAIFPLVVYFQLRGIRDQLFAIQGQIVEANYKLLNLNQRASVPSARQSQGQGNNPLA